MRRVLLGWGAKGGGRRPTKPSLPWAPAPRQPAPATFSSASRLRTLILVVKDPAQSAAFYVDTLGLAVKVQSESMVELTTDGPEHSGAGGIGSSSSSSSSSSGGGGGGGAQAEAEAVAPTWSRSQRPGSGLPLCLCLCPSPLPKIESQSVCINRNRQTYSQRVARD